MSGNPTSFQATIQPIANFQANGNCCLLPCTTTSGSDELLLPTLTGNPKNADVLVYNAGAVAAFINFGDVSVTAVIPTAGTPANGKPIPPGAWGTFNIGAATYVAGITASSTASVYIVQGVGS